VDGHGLVPLRRRNSAAVLDCTHSLYTRILLKRILYIHPLLPGESPATPEQPYREIPQIALTLRSPPILQGFSQVRACYGWAAFHIG
jgi:hypothetical protein